MSGQTVCSVGWRKVEQSMCQRLARLCRVVQGPQRFGVGAAQYFIDNRTMFSPAKPLRQRAARGAKAREHS